MALTASTIVVVVVVVDDALFALTVCSTCYTLLMKEELINDLCYYPRESIVCMYSSLKVDNNNNNMCKSFASFFSLFCFINTWKWWRTKEWVKKKLLCIMMMIMMFY